MSTKINDVVPTKKWVGDNQHNNSGAKIERHKTDSSSKFIKTILSINKGEFKEFKWTQAIIKNNSDQIWVNEIHEWFKRVLWFYDLDLLKRLNSKK